MKTLIIKTEAQLEAALDKGRNMIFDGNIELQISIQSLHKVNNISSGGYIRSVGYIRSDGDISSGGDIRSVGYIRSVGLVKCRKLYWSHYAMPKAKMIECEIVIPKCGDRTYWTERLCINCDGGERAALIRNAPTLKKLLRKKCWSKTERWMMESWQMNGEKLAGKQEIE
jgi:hypothetical protein